MNTWMRKEKNKGHSTKLKGRIFKTTQGTTSFHTMGNQTMGSKFARLL